LFIEPRQAPDCPGFRGRNSPGRHDHPEVELKFGCRVEDRVGPILPVEPDGWFTSVPGQIPVEEMAALPGPRRYRRRRPADIHEPGGFPRLIGGVVGFHWPDLDEDISVSALLR